MFGLSDEDLEQLAAELESDRVERKASLADRSKIRRSICAFANDLAGLGKPGLIFVGLKDNGGCAGIEVNDDLLQQITNMRSSGDILPPPSLVVQRREIRGCELAVIAVAPSDAPPVRYAGRVWVRVGSSVQAASPQDERALAERRRAADFPFDLRPAPQSTREDLDLYYFLQQYLPAAVDPEVLLENERPADQQLRSLRMLARHGAPTYGALLILGKDPLAWMPGAYVQFVRYDGTELVDAPIKDQKQITGPLHAVLRQIDELLEINISTYTDVTSAERELRHSDYPIVALRQLARNAVMHRNYENTAAPARIYWFSDRVEIHSPGGLYGHVNAENFGKGATDYRNPLVAEAMRVLGYVQKFGMGIALAYSEMQKNGNPPPEFDLQTSHVLAILKARK